MGEMSMIRNITALTFAACIACTGATAATYDFADVADGGSFTDSANVGKNGSEADWDTVVGAGLGILAGGISVIGSATNSAGSSAYAYFDSDDAGLGVCGNTGNCNPGNDDNVGAIGGSDNAGGTTFEYPLWSSSIWSPFAICFDQGVCEFDELSHNCS
jgi:hypothetical protein